MALTKFKIKAEIQRRLNLTGKQSDNFVETLLEIIKTTLTSGEDVMISGFGRFSLKQKRERRGRNPATGESLILAPKRVVTFRYSPLLREKLNRRSEPRSIVDQYFSVELSISNLAPIAYQFKIRNISSSSMGFLVKEDSDLFQHLRVGDVINMKYNPVESSAQPKHLKTEIKHITQDEQGRFKGHYLVGLSILTD